MNESEFRKKETAAPEKWVPPSFDGKMIQDTKDAFQVILLDYNGGLHRFGNTFTHETAAQIAARDALAADPMAQDAFVVKVLAAFHKDIHIHAVF